MLENKVGMIFGVANKRSIAWACAEACAAQGAKLAFTYQGERLKENVEKLAGELPDSLVVPCDVTDQSAVDAAFQSVGSKYGKLDFLIHSIAFAPKEALEGEFVTTTREAFRTALEISAFSLTQVAPHYLGTSHRRDGVRSVVGRIRTGITDLFGTRDYQYDLNQAQAWVFSNGIPVTINQYARPLYDKERLNAALGLYAQDRWTISRFTVNYGLRFDYHNAMVPAQDLPAITFVQARHYDEIKNVPNWTDLSPRVGATFAFMFSAYMPLRQR